MNVNALIADSIDVDEKFAMAKQVIETLEKFLERSLHVAQLMKKFEAFTLGE